MEFDNVFHAVLAYLHRYGSKAVMDAVLAVQIDGAGKDFMFIVVNGPDQLGSGRGNAEFGAAFLGVFNISFFMDFLQDFFLGIHMVEIRLFLQQFIDGLACHFDMAPGNHAGIAVFAQKVGGERAAVDFELGRKLHLQAGRVQGCAGADDFLFRPVQFVLQVFCNNVAGIGNGNNNAVKAGFLNQRQEFLAGGNGAIHHVQTVLSLFPGFAGCIDQNICIFHIVHGACIGLKMMGLVADGIQKIQGFADGFVHVGIVEYHFICQTLHGKLEGQMGSYIACSDNTDFPCFNRHTNSTLLFLIFREWAVSAFLQEIYFSSPIWILHYIYHA